MQECLYSVLFVIWKMKIKCIGSEHLHPWRRERLKNSFYEGPVWNKEIEPMAMPMIDSYEAELTETTYEFENLSLIHI